jgi:isopentenyl-diphosphate Delta-isomerase
VFATVWHVQVWTNTCCSHQLLGQEPDEVDPTDLVRGGLVPGAIAAAIRKLEHELGIPPSQLDRKGFTFLTRLLYCAGDRSTLTGQPTGWGEHELDYILFTRVNVSLSPNPEEVDDTKYVTKEELKEMMLPESGLCWSPWFRIIVSNFLFRWWDDLNGTLAGRHADFATIHKLSC